MTSSQQSVTPTLLFMHTYVRVFTIHALCIYDLFRRRPDRHRRRRRHQTPEKTTDDRLDIACKRDNLRPGTARCRVASDSVDQISHPICRIRAVLIHMFVFECVVVVLLYKYRAHKPPNGARCTQTAGQKNLYKLKCLYTLCQHLNKAINIKPKSRPQKR